MTVSNLLLLIWLKAKTEFEKQKKNMQKLVTHWDNGVLSLEQ